MNENSSKQVLLSVLGIAVLVVAVVGVSFAFFTYTRAGTSNNTLTTGSIFFNFEEGYTLNLTNQFPVADSVGSNTTASAEGTEVLTFSITGYDTSSKGIDYTITAYPGAPSNSRVRLRDDEIKLLLTGANKSPSTTTENFFSTPKVITNSANGLNSGVTLAHGNFAAGNGTKNQTTHSYELRMWISDSVEIVDDTEIDVSAEDDHKYRSAQFSNMYYTLRVQVDAETANGTNGVQGTITAPNAITTNFD